MPAPILRLRHRLFSGRSAKSGRCPSLSMEDMHPNVPRFREHFEDRGDGGTGEGDVIAHLVHVSPFSAKSVCMSMMRNTVFSGRRSPLYG